MAIIVATLPVSQHPIPLPSLIDCRGCSASWVSGGIARAAEACDVRSRLRATAASALRHTTRAWLAACGPGLDGSLHESQQFGAPLRSLVEA